MKALKWILAVAAIVVPGVQAEEIVVSWETNGVLVAEGMEPGSTAIVEAVSSMGETFTNAASFFDAEYVVDSNGIIQVAVPMFFRVKGTPASVIVPDLSSLNQSEAEGAIVAEGLSVGAITEQYSSTVAAGLVISQSPLAGESVAPGSAVDFAVSLGILDGADPTATSWEEVNERWVKNIYANGAITMTDRTTNLMWLYDASMLPKANWEDAISICDNLAYAGYSDWFLPDRWQLYAMYSQKAVFSNVQDTGEYPDTAYWSSTGATGYRNSAYVDMSTGYVYNGSSVFSNNRNNIFWVWGCRSIQ